MGTTYKVILYGKNISLSANEIHNTFDQVNHEMSAYLKNSSVSRVNNRDIFEWSEVSQDFINVLTYAITLCNKTKGAYDVSIGRLVNHWGFGVDIKNKYTKQEMVFYEDQIGCDSVEISDNDLSVRRVRDVHLDFSSIAKGYAIDLVHKRILQDNDVESHFIELGGEIRSTSFKANNTPWVVGIEDPKQLNRFLLKLESNAFNNFSVATSGDYRNFRIVDNRNISHTLNTQTREPKKYSKSSVTVVSDSTMKADALATALNSMELDKAVTFSNENKINAVFLNSKINDADLIFSNTLAKIVK